MMLANTLPSNTTRRWEYPRHRAGVTVFFLPAYPFLSVTPSQPPNHAGYSAFAKRHIIDGVTDKNGLKAASLLTCDSVTDTEGGKGNFPLTLSFCDVTAVTGVTASNGAGCSGNVCLFGDVTGVTRLPKPPFHGYPTLAPAKSGVGNLTPKEQRRISAPTSTALFLCPSVMVAVRGQASAWPVSFVAGCEIPRTVAPIENLTSKGDSENKGASPMTKLRLSLAHVRAKAHRKMAFAALHADSSLSVRLKRYQHHIDRARALEAKEVRP